MCTEIYRREFQTVTDLTYPDNLYDNTFVVQWGPDSNSVRREIAVFRDILQAIRGLNTRSPEERELLSEDALYKIRRLNDFENVLSTFS